MPAAYDSYDYPSYWSERQYEHNAEVFAIKKFLEKIPSIKSVLEIGTGYGRLVPEYEFRAEKIVLTDPSAKLLKIARSKFTSRKFKFIHASIDSLKQKIKRDTYDLVVIVRVLHHIEDVEGAMEFIYKVLKPGGFIILEFPNKKHIKASIIQFLKGNTTYTIDISKKNLNTNKDALPFFNYHPEYIKKLLAETGFKVIEKRSVSNVRSKRVKSMVSPSFLHTIEKKTQTFLSSLDFGPSIFVLAQKKKGK